MTVTQLENALNSTYPDLTTAILDMNKDDIASLIMILEAFLKRGKYGS